MPRADIAIRIQRTPALKYIGVSLVEEAAADTELPAWEQPLPPHKSGVERQPLAVPCPLRGVPCPAFTSREQTHIPKRAWGSSSLVQYQLLLPQPCIHVHIMPRRQG